MDDVCTFIVFFVKYLMEYIHPFEFEVRAGYATLVNAGDIQQVYKLLYIVDSPCIAIF